MKLRSELSRSEAKYQKLMARMSQVMNIVDKCIEIDSLKLDDTESEFSTVNGLNKLDQESMLSLSSKPKQESDF